MKIKRSDYRTQEEWRKACKAVKKFKKNRKPKTKKRKVTKKSKSKRLRKYHKYLLSDEWAQLKIDIFAARGKSCERCGSKSSVQVHHLTYKNIFNEEPEDLLILCRNCHKDEHGIK